MTTSAPPTDAPPAGRTGQQGLVHRLVALLPVGTLAVGTGLVVLGVASYIHLAVAGHALSTAGYSNLSVAWSIVFSIGVGLFMPIEQEIARLVAARRVAGDGYAPVYWRGASLALGLLAVCGVLLLTLAGPLAGALFDGDRQQLWVLFGGLVGLALAHPTRGLLSGTGRFGGYGAQLGIDGGLRIVLALALGAAGVHSAVAYGLILTVAPIVSVLATSPLVTRLLSHGSRQPWLALGRAVGPLMVSTLLAQLVVNVGVINVKLLDPGDTALAGALLSALILARIPVFVFASLQAALLPGLATLVASGHREQFRHLLIRACGLVLLPCALIGLPAIFLGPWAVKTLFGAAPVLGDWDFALLVTGTTVYLLALVLGQGVLALGRHERQTIGWVVGTAALIGVTLVPGDVSLRVGAGYAVGSAVVALVLLGMLLWSRGRPGPAGPVTEPDTALVPAGQLP